VRLFHINSDVAMFLKFELIVLFFFGTFILFADPELEVIGSDSFHFDKYPANQDKIASFTIKNSGDETLKIKSIRKTCGCFKPSSNKMELPPNESATIKVEVEAYGIYKSYSKFVFVYSNDPKNPIQKLRVSGNADPLVEVLPQDKVFIGNVSKEQDVVREFLIKPFGKNSVKLKEPKVQSTHELKASITEENGSYRIKVVYDKSRKAGRIKSTIKIPVEEPKGWKDLELTLYGRAKAPVKNE